MSSSFCHSFLRVMIIMRSYVPLFQEGDRPLSALKKNSTLISGYLSRVEYMREKLEHDRLMFELEIVQRECAKQNLNKNRRKRNVGWMILLSLYWHVCCKCASRYIHVAACKGLICTSALNLNCVDTHICPAIVTNSLPMRSSHKSILCSLH